MRNPNRIPSFLAILERVWWKVPDVRFFQLISGITKGEDLFYMEDEEVIKLIIELEELL